MIMLIATVLALRSIRMGGRLVAGVELKEEFVQGSRPASATRSCQSWPGWL
ncbi:hypothetical protein [Herbidospora yilanensis]|uniref:hypothetical protein n=1 Tax=Herbidospora yilanensis TaxID=354426 RepID=UPI000AD969A0|nr:hypothetical protein [Herbidospora yilanensis]